jgi:hypothetical protein
LASRAASSFFNSSSIFLQAFANAYRPTIFMDRVKGDRNYALRDPDADFFRRTALILRHAPHLLGNIAF